MVTIKNLDDLSRHLNIAVDALARFAPERLAELSRRDDGLYAEKLRPGQGATQGGGDRKLAAEVWADALETASKRARDQVQVVLGTLRAAGWLELAVAIAASISGSALIALLSGGVGTKANQITVAAIALACSITSSVIAFMRRGPLNSDRIEECRKANNLTAEATVVVLHLRSLSQGTEPDGQLIQRADGLLNGLLALDLW